MAERTDPANDQLDDPDRVVPYLNMLKSERVNISESPDQLVCPADNP
jgi:hypothetical protein